MLQLKTILVPTDCSVHSKISLRYAARLATEFGASVTLLYVEKQAEQKKENTISVMSEYSRNCEGQKNLKNFLESEDSPGSEFNLVVLEGEVVSEIINYTKNKVVDLIVMSSHGYKGLAYSMKGSITEKVTRYANCPVLCLKNEGQHFIK
ncbi:MAG: universal stress protein [Proteobacteria bacterium]|nr:universal stress protein [Pseudomonadota bacterium]